MGMIGRRLIFGVVTIIVAMFTFVILISAESWQQAFLPALFGVSRPSIEPMEEVRALWVTRFDWTDSSGADPAKIDEIVERAASAGFNTLYFQVRGEADAYYSSNLEPWSSRLNAEKVLGRDPGWDPLQRLVERAHASDLQVHAYINVYPLWTGCDAPPDNTIPRHLYHQLKDFHGTTDGKLNGVQWNTKDEVVCSPYFRVSPASIFFDNHLLEVTKDLVQNYDINGIHLDHIRYAEENFSCDPVSEERSGAECFDSVNYAELQRRQINGTVEKLYKELILLNPDLWLTAAVWPVYRDFHGWGVKSGYDTYYQDPGAWLTGGYIDSVSPMIYSGSPNCDNPYFWTRERWATLVSDYQAVSGGRYVVPGIGVHFCSADDFTEIEARIKMARDMGTAGHAIFSYNGLLNAGYFDDLANGPYSVPANVPEISWH
jgi:uncharacterized lipoprotein YddW (UPF0748 family)